MLFNPSSLPADVRARFQHKQDKKILTQVIHTPHNCPGDACHDVHHWIDAGLEKTICCDGTIFFHVPVDERMVMKNPVPCRKDTHAAICRWHQTFQETLMQHGVYVHPLWLFKKNHGGEWGFIIGDSRDDDVPTPLRMTCQQSSTLIYQLLSQSMMFPTGSGSPLHDTVANCHGDGLKALKAILQRSHPAFVDEPATLVTQHPRQKEKSLLEHKMEAEDCLQMRSVAQGFSKELDDPNELDIFINDMKQSTFIQRVTRDERRQRALLHKHQGDKLLETLNSFLMMPDCPGNEAVRAPRAVRQVSTPPGGAATGNRTSQIPQLHSRRGARINAVGAASPNLTDTSGSGAPRSSGGSSNRTNPEECCDCDQGVPNEDVPDPFTNYEEACVNLMQIEVPDRDDTPSNMLTCNDCRRAVLAIRENPNAAYAQHCVACRGQHRFENRPTLNDHDFLKQHCIRFCQNVRRDQTELSQQRTEPVNFMDRRCFEDNEESESDSDRDFPCGRR